MKRQFVFSMEDLGELALEKVCFENRAIKILKWYSDDDETGHGKVIVVCECEPKAKEKKP